ncbi:hypothetical protein [Kocuria marina]|uniref:hypothetical protein n=1 Tax=Kocuria marina TaxID=223184 RepID=UPI0034601E85
MTSTIGCHSPEDQKILHEGHRVFVSCEAKLREMPGTPLEGSRLFGLDQEESLLISPSRTLQHSLLTAITNGIHAGETAINAPDPGPDAWVMAPPSRAILVGATRVIYVLLGGSKEEQYARARRVALSETMGYSMLLSTAKRFEDLVSLRPDEKVVDSIVAKRDRLKKEGVKKFSDTDTITESGEAVRTALEARGIPWDQSKVLVEQLQWAWNVWSGMTHGLGWPELAPGDFADNGVYPMPGSWVVDYHAMAAVTSIATALYGQALIQDTDPSL